MRPSTRHINLLRGLLCVALALMLFIASTAAAAGSTGITYTRERLRAEQDLARRYCSEGQLCNDAATRLLEAGLVREAAEALVRSTFLVDLADVSLEGHSGRVGQLKGSLAYSKAEEQNRLGTSHTALRQQVGTAQERAARLRDRCKSASIPSAVVLQVFLVKRENFRTRMRLGMSEPNLALDECRRLAVFPLALVAAGLVNGDNATGCRLRPDGSVVLPDGQTVYPDASTEASTRAREEKAGVDLARMRAEKEQLQGEVLRLRGAREGPRAVVDTGEPRTTNTEVPGVTNVVGGGKPVPAPVPAVAPAIEPQAGRQLNPVVNAPPVPRSGANAPTRAISVPRAWGFALACVLLVPALILVWWWFRRTASDPALEALLEGDRAQGVPTALLVTETEHPADGDAGPRVLRREEAIPMAPNAPVSFGTNPGLSTCVVAPIAGAEAAELFTITLMGPANLRLEAAVNTLCDGQPVARKGSLLRCDRPFHVRIGTREWELTPTTEADRRNAVSTLFERLQPEQRVVPQADIIETKEIQHA